jgi:hypothetical protein
MLQETHYVRFRAKPRNVPFNRSRCVLPGLGSYPDEINRSGGDRIRSARRESRSPPLVRGLPHRVSVGACRVLVDGALGEVEDFSDLPSRLALRYKNGATSLTNYGRPLTTGAKFHPRRKG